MTVKGKIQSCDYERVKELIAAHPEANKIRVYASSGSFVANSYKWRCEIPCLDAVKGEDGIWEITENLVDAKRPHGFGAYETINGRAVQ